MKARMDFYYGGAQATLYDAHRDRMLHGKLPLIMSIPWRQSAARQRLLLVGGGTGDLLAKMGPILSQLSGVTVSDLSTPMIEVARARLRDLGIEDRARAVVEDACASFQPHPDGSYDVVIISYALTMMPRWKECVDNAVHHLAPEGVLGVCDFCDDDASSIDTQRFMFRLSGVDVTTPCRAYLASHGQLTTLFQRTARGSLPFTSARPPYFYAVYRRVRRPGSPEA
jgi:ubiquinone/menaquinone biosynthesis C-methylase UbiE